MVRSQCAVSRFRLIGRLALLLLDTFFFLGGAGGVIYVWVSFGTFPWETKKTLFIEPVVSDRAFEILPMGQTPPRVDVWVGEESFIKLAADSDVAIVVFIEGDWGAGRRLAYQTEQSEISFGYRGELANPAGSGYGASGIPVMVDGHFEIPAKRSVFAIPIAILVYGVAVALIAGFLFSFGAGLWLCRETYQKLQSGSSL